VTGRGRGWAFTAPQITPGLTAGGERAAIAYSIIGSCRLAGVDPCEYLADVLPRLTGRIRLVDLPSLLPSRWAAQRAASAAAAAATVAAQP
jgi:hypothetical protein